MKYDSIYKEKLDKMSADMQANETKALRNRLVKIRLSKRRFLIVEIKGAVPFAATQVFAGDIVCRGDEVGCEGGVREFLEGNASPEQRP